MESEIPAQNVGIAIFDVYGNIENGTMYNNDMYGNTVGWMCWASRCARMDTGTTNTSLTIAVTIRQTSRSPQTPSRCRRRTTNTRPGWRRSAPMEWLSAPSSREAPVQWAHPERKLRPHLDHRLVQHREHKQWPVRRCRFLGLFQWDSCSAIYLRRRTDKPGVAIPGYRQRVLPGSQSQCLDPHRSKSCLGCNWGTIGHGGPDK